LENNNLEKIITINAAKVFEDVFVELAERNREVVFISADSYIGAGAKKFKERYPERFFEFGIAEQNACSHAAGMAFMGKKPFFCTIATFATMRCFEQIRNDIARPNLNVVIIGRGAGMSYSIQGPTHVSIDDIGVLRNLKNLTIIDPADSLDFKNAILESVKISGPVYIRAHKKLPLKIIRNKLKFRIGKGQLIKEGNDVTIVACGPMVSKSINSSILLKERKIDSEIINLHTIKPLDRELILKSAKKTKKIVSIEEHSIINGLGSGIADVLSENCNARLLKIGFDSNIAIEGPYDDVLSYYGLQYDEIAVQVEEFVNMN